MTELQRKLIRRRQAKPLIDFRTLTLAIQLLTLLRKMLSGYKTYIVGTVAIIGALGAYLSGDVTLPDTMQTILTAILGMTLRSGVASAAKP